MATHAPITGAPTRAPSTDKYDVSSQVATVQTMLGRIEALCFGMALITNDFGAIEDESQRELVGHLINFTDLIAATNLEAQAACEAVEIGVRRFEREGR